MDRNEIIRMAQKAGLYHFYDSEGHCDGITDARLVTEDRERDDDRLVEMLAPFVSLVVAAEREACAKVCDVTPPYPFRPSIEAAHAIRARDKE